MLATANIFMTFAWYGHLKKGGYAMGKPLIAIILISWGIAFFEYCLMIPANRMGYGAGLSAAQLKIAQEAITLLVFVPFAVLFLGESWKWDYVWAFLCIMLAVFFVNRSSWMAEIKKAEEEATTTAILPSPESSLNENFNSSINESLNKSH